MKIVVNKCYGGFGLSAKAVVYFLKLKGKKAYFYDGLKEYKKIKSEEAEKSYFFHVATKDLGAKTTSGKLNKHYWSYNSIERTDPDLIETIEKLGKEANSKYSALRVVDIPDGIEWEIDEYDGIETVHEKHRSW